MSKVENVAHFSRRSILKGGGALVVSIGMPIGLDAVLAIQDAFAQGTKPPLTPDQLSSYIAPSPGRHPPQRDKRHLRCNRRAHSSAFRSRRIG